MENSEVIEIGKVEVDLRRRELRRDGEPITVQPRVFDLLVYLAEHQPRVITKAELLETVWRGDSVVPDVLATAFHSLRRALGDDPKQPVYIRTVHRIGYQLIADVKRQQEPTTPDARFPALEARHLAFVGRRLETGLFDDMLAGATDVQLLFVHGLPGMGKTTLLQELIYRSRRAGIEHLRLSGESAGPFVDTFLRALADGLGCANDLGHVREALAAKPRVLFIDDVHWLPGVDEWLRQELWPSLPASVRLVLAGRRAPSARWRCDPAWQRTARPVELSGLNIEDARLLLERSGANPDSVDALWSRTRGHPLALALAADILGRGGRLQSEAFDADALVGWFTDHLTDRSRLHALEVASLLDEVSEPTLAALDSSETAAENMRWLSTLSFAESRGETVRLHLLVRDAVIARLVSQDCGRLADLLERSQHYWLGEFRRMTDVGSKYRAIEMIVGMGRYHPALRANYAASDQGQACSVRPGTSRDHASLLDVIGRFEGERSRLINAAWLAHPATRVMAVCDDSDAPAGYLVTLRIRVSDSAAAETAGDPIIAAVLRALQEEGVGPEEEVLIHRTLIARDDYQAPSMVTRHLHSLKILIMWDHKNERVPSHQVSVYGEGDVWESSATSAGLARMRSCETPLEGRVYTPYVVSLREFPVEEWFLRASARIVEALRAQGSGMK